MAGTKPGAKRGRYQPSSKRAAKRWRVFAYVRAATLTAEECLGASIPLRPARVPWKRLARIGVGAEVEVMPTREWLEFNREELEADLRREAAAWRARKRPFRARKR